MSPELTEWVHVWHGRKLHIPAAGRAHLTMCGKPWMARWIKNAPETLAADECRRCFRKAARGGEKVTGPNETS